MCSEYFSQTSYVSGFWTLSSSQSSPSPTHCCRSNLLSKTIGDIGGGTEKRDFSPIASSTGDLGSCKSRLTAFNSAPYCVIGTLIIAEFFLVYLVFSSLVFLE